MKYVITMWMMIGIILSSVSYVSAQDLIAEGAEPEVITNGYQFTEGPLWHPDGYLLFSDIPANTIFKWTPGKEAEVFVKPSGSANGIALYEDGNLVVAQHSGKISRITSDRTLETLVASYKRQRLNSPNDLTVSADGFIYFTDPPFGVSEENRELDFSGVYMLSPDLTLTPFYRKFSSPNGIILSPDETKLYVNNSETGQIMVFDLDKDGTPVNPRTFASVGSGTDQGSADGMTIDSEGRVYSTGPGGVFIFDVNGNQIRKIETEDRISNLAFGGEHNRTLFMTAPSVVYSLKMDVKGK